MFKHVTGRLVKILMNQKKLCHIFKIPQRQYRVTVIGAGGGIGQPLTLLLKQSPLVTQLNLYDLHHSAGVGADLSHIETPALVCSFMGLDQLKNALSGSDIVTIVAGVPRKPGMSRDDLFSVNANIIRDVFCGIAKHCPKALVSIVSNPVNSLVPLAAEIMDINGVFDPCRLFGVTTLDIVRANTFIAELKGLNPLDVNCPCIGGHAGTTIIPVISQCCPRVEFTEPQLKELTKRVQEAGTEVVKAKEGKGSATLSTAFATARLTFAMCRGLRGEKGVVECSYVRSDVTDAKFFSTPLVLGKNGIEKNLGLGKLTEYECEQVRNAIPQIQKNIETGINFVHNLAKK